MVDLGNILRPVFGSARQGGKTIAMSTAMDRLINKFIADNKSIVIGSDRPEEHLQELRTRFPNAKFELCGMGVRLCSK